jgi:hypothetical protein
MHKILDDLKNWQTSTLNFLSGPMESRFVGGLTTFWGEKAKLVSEKKRSMIF